MTWLVVLASIGLACAAAAGVLLPFGRTRSPDLEPVDALQDERSSLLHALRDLDDEATGQLSEETYRALRRETEGRTVAVLRAIEAGTDWASSPQTFERFGRNPTWSDGDGSAPSRPVGRRMAVTVVGGAVIVAVLAAVIAGAVRTRLRRSITGTLQGGLSFFEQRGPAPQRRGGPIGSGPALPGIGGRPVGRGAVHRGARPRSAQRGAHAQLGFVLYRAGRAQDGLEAVQQALQVDPTYPEALFFEGVILLKGLDRPAEAAAAFRAYLAAAPFGAHVDEVKSLLQEAEADG